MVEVAVGNDVVASCRLTPVTVTSPGAMRREVRLPLQTGKAFLKAPSTNQAVLEENCQPREAGEVGAWLRRAGLTCVSVGRAAGPG